MNAGRGTVWQAVMVAAALLAWTPPLAAADVEGMILAEAERKGVPGALALAVAQSAASLGAGQAMPLPGKAAAELYQVDPKLLANSSNLNIQVAVDYLSRQLKAHDGDWRAALGHYYDASEEPTPGEEAFVNGVLARQQELSREGRGGPRKVTREDDLLKGWTPEDLAAIDAGSPTGSAHRSEKKTTPSRKERTTSEPGDYVSQWEGEEQESGSRTGSSRRDEGWDSSSRRDEGWDSSSRRDEGWGSGYDDYGGDGEWSPSTPPRRYTPPPRSERENTLRSSREETMVRECLRRTRKSYEACRQDVWRVLRGLPPW